MQTVSSQRRQNSCTCAGRVPFSLIPNELNGRHCMPKCILDLSEVNVGIFVGISDSQRSQFDDCKSPTNAKINSRCMKENILYEFKNSTCLSVRPSSRRIWDSQQMRSLARKASGASGAVLYNDQRRPSESSILVYSRNSNGLLYLFKGRFSTSRAGVSGGNSRPTPIAGIAGPESRWLVPLCRLNAGSGKRLAHSGSFRSVWSLLAKRTPEERGPDQHRHPRRSALRSEYRKYYGLSHSGRRKAQCDSVVHSLF